MASRKHETPIERYERFTVNAATAELLLSLISVWLFVVRYLEPFAMPDYVLDMRWVVLGIQVVIALIWLKARIENRRKSWGK